MKTMDYPTSAIISGILMNVITVMLMVLAAITLQAWAAIATIVAAVSTLLINVFKFFSDRKRQRKQNSDQPEKPEV